MALTATHQSGSRDRVAQYLDRLVQHGKLRDYGIWDYNDLRGFIDGDADIRSAYGHFITAGDVLAEVIRSIASLRRPDFTDVMHVFLQKELIADASAKLQSAGEDPERQIPLAHLFVDLPFAETAEKSVLADEQEDDKFPTVVDCLLGAGATVLRRTFSDATSSGNEKSIVGAKSRFVVVGGPGQGKSTFGQYVCQLYRAAILRDRPRERLDERVESIIRQLDRQQKDSGGLPITRRFPIRIELRNFAHALSAEPRLTLFDYVRKDMSRLGNASILAEDLKSWLTQYPWLLVLDGLDEVPPSSNRRAILDEIGSLRVDLASGNADVLVVATTRPQGYSKDFPEEQFAHLYLAPLSPNRALSYGRKLAQAWCGSDERRQDELTRSLEKACQNPTTSRLMQSPLQVTIMATLLEETGEPPQQRYRLFAEYYRTIYKRETRRKLLGGILSERQKDIDTIHQQVGLVLHARGESAEAGTRAVRVDDLDSALSDEEFRVLVRYRLEQIGVSDPRASELLDTISASSLQRLVFLVRPREGWVKFDVTSFKEFMAAEALMNGSDDDVRLRLTAIAAVTYWRNVFQFAVGKCFVEREHLLDTLVSLCLGLNDEKGCERCISDETAARAAKAVLWGSRLALDVLADGTARQYPGYEVRFAAIALLLLRVWDIEICARLASVFHEDLKSLYLDAIRDRLAHSENWSRVGAFHLLADLADGGNAWAAEILRDTWPKEFSVQKEILLHRVRRTPSDWAAEKAAELAPNIEPYWLMRYSGVPSTDKQSESRLAPLYRVVRLLEPETRGGLDVAIQSTGNRTFTRLTLTPCSVPPEAWEGVRAMEFRSEAWFPLIAAVRFGASPSAHALANELRWLAEQWDMRSYFWLASCLPWPLAACLERAQSNDELNFLAASASRGDLGDREHWFAAERRWRQAGVADVDLSKNFGVLPFDPGVANVGLPVGAASILVDQECSWADIDTAIKDISNIGDVHAQRRFARELFELALYPGVGKGQVQPNKLRLLYEMSQGGRGRHRPSHVNLEAFWRFGLSLTDEWVDFLDWLGRLHVYVDVDVAQTEIAQELIHHFSADPERRRGLLRIIAAIAESGYRCVLPRQVLDLAASWGAPEKEDALSLRLAGYELSKSELASLAREIVSSDKMNMNAYRVLRCASVSSLRQGAELALQLLAPGGETSELNIVVARVAGRRLVEFLTNMPSSLRRPDTWNELKLPARV